MTAFKCRIPHFRAPLVALLLLLTACDDNDLRQLSKVLHDTSAATQTLQETALQANTSGLLTDAEARPLMVLSVTVSKGILQSVAMTRELQKLDATQKTQLLAVLKPVVDAVGTAANDPAISKISNAQTRAKVQATITIIQSALSTAQLILAVK